VDKYVVVNKKLGQGTYGVVYNGFVKGNETQKVAVKTLPIKVNMAVDAWSGVRVLDEDDAAAQT
jgi:hypothetical protein